MRGERAIPMDIYKRGDEYIVELDLPGVPPDQIEVTTEVGAPNGAGSDQAEQTDQAEHAATPA
jgi:HSP20 family molecular chaperone IbpA